MKLVRAAQLDEKVLAQFFEDKWKDMAGIPGVVEYGYLVDNGDNYEAYFALHPLDSDIYWLKNLYVKAGAPPTYALSLIESSIALVREKGASALFVYSHQEALDTLLETLRFERCDTPSVEAVGTETSQQWWKAHVTESYPQT